MRRFLRERLNSCQKCYFQFRRMCDAILAGIVESSTECEPNDPKSCPRHSLSRLHTDFTNLDQRHRKTSTTKAFNECHSKGRRNRRAHSAFNIESVAKNKATAKSNSKSSLIFFVLLQKHKYSRTFHIICDTSIAVNNSSFWLPHTDSYCRIATPATMHNNTRVEI